MNFDDYLAYRFFEWLIGTAICFGLIIMFFIFRALGRFINRK